MATTALQQPQGEVSPGFEAVRDASGRILTFTLTDMNTRGEQLFGAPFSKLANRPLNEWCPFGNCHDCIESFGRVVETRGSIEEEVASDAGGARHADFPAHQLHDQVRAGEDLVRHLVHGLEAVPPGDYRVVSCYLKLEPRDKTRGKYLALLERSFRRGQLVFRQAAPTERASCL